MWSLLLSLVAAGPGREPGPVQRPVAVSVAPVPCRSCHQSIVDSYAHTAHQRTSTQAGKATILGDFSPGHNLLRTRTPGVGFTMERRADAFYQTGRDSVAGGTRTERIDLVIGSGRRGQSYLYWRTGLLFELPVSYLTGVRQWINSPGYIDGQIDFNRLIEPRCLECHATSFTLAPDRRVRRYSDTYQLGVGCQKCHGDAQKHIAYHVAHPDDTTGQFVFNPATATRNRQIDVCAICHSGARDEKRPAFSFRPGDSLDAFLSPEAGKDVVPDVHGNQVALLRRSKCFQSSPGMSCSTCHDVHQTQRDVAAFVPHCLQCHDATQHPGADSIGARLTAYCIDCHMPNRRSNAIRINTARSQSSLYFRSHEIAVYRDVAAQLLRPNP
jgi:cytochrome c554/c'-like protein